MEVTASIHPLSIGRLPIPRPAASHGAPFGMTVTIGVHNFSTSGLLNIGILDSFVDQYTVLAVSSAGDLTLELFFVYTRAIGFN
jgi:hypothetical protein